MFNSEFVVVAIGLSLSLVYGNNYKSGVLVFLFLKSILCSVDEELYNACV